MSRGMAIPTTVRSAFGAATSMFSPGIGPRRARALWNRCRHSSPKASGGSSTGVSFAGMKRKIAFRTKTIGRYCARFSKEVRAHENPNSLELLLWIAGIGLQMRFDSSLSQESSLESESLVFFSSGYFAHHRDKGIISIGFSTISLEKSLLSPKNYFWERPEEECSKHVFGGIRRNNFGWWVDVQTLRSAKKETPREMIVFSGGYCAHIYGQRVSVCAFTETRCTTGRLRSRCEATGAVDHVIHAQAQADQIRVLIGDDVGRVVAGSAGGGCGLDGVGHVRPVFLAIHSELLCRIEDPALMALPPCKNGDPVGGSSTDKAVQSYPEGYLAYASLLTTHSLSSTR